MHKRIVQVGTMMVILSLSFAMLLYTHTKVNAEPEKIVIQNCMLYTEQMDGNDGVSLYLELQEEEFLWINGWEREGQWYLFLPSVLQGQEVVLGDKTRILQEGEWSLSNKNGKQMEVRILFGSEIPFVWLTTDSGDLEFIEESKANQEEGILYCVGADRTLEYGGRLTKVKIRGNSTRLQPKKPFRIKLEHEASLGGLASARDYVLLAEYGDISLMRNKAAMELANRTTDLYEPLGEHIDLYVNGEYMGVYLLCEGISVGKNRLEITNLKRQTEKVNDKMLAEYEPFARSSGEDTIVKGYEIPNNPRDITGGYLLELEYHGRYEGEEMTGFRTAHDWSFVIKEPSCASIEQVEYIQEQFQQVEDAIYAPDWTAPDTGAALEELTDLESFVHKYLMDEICMNTDPWTSQFLYKDSGDDKFYFGPMWDYDMAFGHYDEGFSPEEFYVNWHIWYEEVYDHPQFQEILKETYQNRCLPVLNELTDAKLSEWEEKISDSARMNFMRWDIEEIYSRNFIIHTGDSFEECVDSLRDFIKTRTEFLSTEWLNL